jgi:hypothetical protein
LIDLWTINKIYLNNSNYQVPVESTVEPFEASNADEIILKDTDPTYRVLNLNGTFSDNQTSFFHRSVAGYHPAKLRLYEDLLNAYLRAEISYLTQVLPQTNLTPRVVNQIFERTPVLNMLNTKYVIVDPNSSPIQNPKAYGHLWKTGEIIKTSEPDAMIKQLGQIDLQNQAITMDEIPETISNNNQSSSNTGIDLDQYYPHKQYYSVSLEEETFVTFSEIWHPYWTASTQDEEIDIVRVNWLLRGAYLPKGDYELVFSFEPETIVKAYMIEKWSSIFLILGLVSVLLTSLPKSYAFQE